MSSMPRPLKLSLDASYVEADILAFTGILVERLAVTAVSKERA